jgi:hypothetical protein
MPSTSQAQQIAMAIAEHAPSKLYARNKGLLKMSKPQLHDFAATPRKGLPKRKAPPRTAGPTAPLSAALRARGA